MLALALKVIFCIISTLLNLVTRLIFSATAYLVFLIQTFKVPGEALHGALEQLAEAIKSCFEYFLEQIIELTGSVISSFFSLFIEAVTSSASVSTTTFATLVEKTRTSLAELLTGLPEIAEGFSEMILNMTTGFWNSYKYAMEYVTENA